jgi:hypothetical protein
MDWPQSSIPPEARATTLGFKSVRQDAAIGARWAIVGCDIEKSPDGKCIASCHAAANLIDGRFGASIEQHQASWQRCTCAEIGHLSGGQTRQTGKLAVCISREWKSSPEPIDQTQSYQPPRRAKFVSNRTGFQSKPGRNKEDRPTACLRQSGDPKFIVDQVSD